jgi:peptide/nickel transport system ATP-binding protein
MNLAPVSLDHLLEVRGLTVTLGSGAAIVSDIDLDIAPGEILGLVGESGSGKTTIANALLGHARPGTWVTKGSVWIEGENILALDPAALRAARGRLVAHVAQDPAQALNPMMRIGKQLDETLAIHEPGLSRPARRERIDAVVRDVGLPGGDELLARFPHQLSGGQQQRVLLALAFVLRPRLIVLDEPTTALDVTTQAQVLGVIRRLCRDQGISALYVSHDLAVVRGLVDRVIVLYSGRIAESARRDALFEGPGHPYARGLLAAIPDAGVRHILQPIAGHAPAPGDRPAGCAFAPRCALRTEQCTIETPALLPFKVDRLVACHHPRSEPLILTRPDAARDLAPSEKGVLLTVKHAEAYYGPRQILFDVDLTLAAGRCTALVGESGSGKTTLARALVGLGESLSGQITYAGQTWNLDQTARSLDLRRRIQYVFQNPYRALNPRQTVGDILRTAIRHFFPVSRVSADIRARAVLDRVALPADVLSRRPHDLSGGERQRVAIARALVCEPELLICDEITSALDVSVQAAILALLGQLQADGLTILFVTHDLAVVRAIADRVVVLRGGRVVEDGDAGTVLDHPGHAYTARLLSDSPRLQGNEKPAPQLVLA